MARSTEEDLSEEKHTEMRRRSVASVYVIATTLLLLLASAAAAGDAMRLGFERACCGYGLYDREEQ